MSKRQKILWVIDILTIVFILIALKSVVESVEKSAYSSLMIKILRGIQHCGERGWSDVLYQHLGLVVPWTKFLLFIANVYAVIRKAIGIFTRDISSKSRALVAVNLLFIILKLIKFEAWWAGLMSV